MRLIQKLLADGDKKAEMNYYCKFIKNENKEIVTK